MATLSTDSDTHAGGPGGKIEARTARVLLSALFFVSGAVGLAYEIVWSRALHGLVGNTPAGSVIVLGVFVGALGLGARWGGRRAGASTRPLARYGVLEVAAAAWALLVLPLAGLLEGPYVALAGGLGEGLRYAVRLVLAALVVMPGAFLLGATLPFMVRAWPPRADGPSRAVPWLYGINTLGAVAGAWLAGFVLIEALGVTGALTAAAVTGSLVGVLALLGSARRVIAPLPPAPPDVAPLVRGGLWAAFACGFLGMTLQALGLRTLVFFVEGFTTSIAAAVGVFVLGLGAGSLLLGPWAARTPTPRAALGGLVLGLWVWVFWWEVPRNQLEGWLTSVRSWAYAGASTPEALEAGHRWVALAGSGVLLLVPAMLLGPTFTLCMRWVRGGGAHETRAVGGTYLANSVGSVLGPTLFALVLVPRLGIDGARYVLGTGALVLMLLATRRIWPGSQAIQWSAAIALLVVLAWHGWKGPERRGWDVDLVEASHVLARKPDRTLLAVRADAVTTASVVETGGDERILYTDDFAAAATGSAYRYMRLLGHLPALLAERQEHALVIAFGTGTTAGAVAKHPGVKRLEVAEVSRAVLDLAPWFDDVHGKVLADPRTQVHVTDGRDALLLHPGDLDVITLEPLMPYSPAGLPFYTREFYALARERLRDGGVLCQWVPVHAMRVGLYEALLRAFFEEFPDGNVWFFEQSTALIGRKGAPPPGAKAGRVPAPSREEIARRFEAVRAHLEEAGFPSLDALEAACFAGGRTVLARPPAEPGFSDRPVVDRDPWPEFHATPRGVLTSYLGDTLHLLTRLAQAGAPPAPFGTGQPAWTRLHQGTLLALEARTLDARAQHMGLVSPRAAAERLTLLEQSAQRYGQALERLEGDEALTWRRARAAREAAELVVRSLLAQAGEKARGGDDAAARDLRRSALRRAAAAAALPDGVPAWARRGSATTIHALALMALGRCEAAERVLGATGPLDLPPGEAGALQELRGLIETRLRGGEAPAWLGPLPQCDDVPDPGLLDALQGWDQARRAARPNPRAVRAAARSLVAAAEAEVLEADALALVEGRGAGDTPFTRAAHAALVALLTRSDEPLRVLIRDGSLDDALAAAAEAGALKRLRATPAASLQRLRAAAAPEARIAFLDACAEDGDKALLGHGIALLADPERDVRHAAIRVVLPHDMQQLSDYDLDVPSTWERVQARLR